jgi:CBS domain-containing protein
VIALSFSPLFYAEIAMTYQSKTHPKPSPEQLDLIERFRVAFNQIEAHLRFELREPNDTSFTRLVHRYAEQNLVWGNRAGYQLSAYAELRNTLVHTRFEREQFVCVPMPFVVERIEQIRDELLEKERVIPKFQRVVRTVKTNDKLSYVLEIIAEEDFSQFPVYDEGGEFRGLLTENGITRWLAHHTVREMTLVDFEDTLVDAVL